MAALAHWTTLACVLLALRVAHSQAAPKVVAACEWSDMDAACEPSGAAAVVAAGATGTYTGFEAVLAKSAAYSALCKPYTTAAACPSDTCQWDGECSNSAQYNDAAQIVDLLASPGTQGGDFLRCVMSSYIPLLSGAPAPACSSQCSSFDFASPIDGTSTHICVPRWSLDLGEEQIQAWVSQAISVWTGDVDSKYDPTLYGCNPGYILSLLDSNVGCGSARTKAACGGKGHVGMYCDWNKSGGRCESSLPKLFNVGRRPALVIANARCAAYKTSETCASQTVAAPLHTELVALASQPQPVAKECPMSFWEAVDAWASPFELDPAASSRTGSERQVGRAIPTLRRGTGSF